MLKHSWQAEEHYLFEKEALFLPFTYSMGRRDSAVGTATVYGLDDQGFRTWGPLWRRIFISPLNPLRFWSPPSLLTNEYRELSLRGWNGRDVKLTTELKALPSSKISRCVYPLSHKSSWRSASSVKNKDSFTFTMLVISFPAVHTYIRNCCDTTVVGWAGPLSAHPFGYQATHKLPVRCL
jgi:hypothetical protein